jgi:hypothetical protein
MIADKDIMVGKRNFQLTDRNIVLPEQNAGFSIGNSLVVDRNRQFLIHFRSLANGMTA